MEAVRVRALTAGTLKRWPLPDAGAQADKEERGHVLVVAGSEQMPGAALLAAEAALRAGAGKLTVAAPQAIASGLALALPESRVIGVRTGRAAGLHAASAVAALAAVAPSVRAVVIGPGMQNQAQCLRLVKSLLPLFSHATVVLDALALNVAPQIVFTQPVVLTPHAGEMAALTARSKAQVGEDPAALAAEVACACNASVVLKGGRTFIAGPHRSVWCFTGDTPGLATSGSGDTLAGLIGGLAARGLAPEAACAWAVILHARAGRALARRVAPLGYLAREIPGEVPAQLRALTQASVQDRSPARTQAQVKATRGTARSAASSPATGARRREHKAAMRKLGLTAKAP